MSKKTVKNGKMAVTEFKLATLVGTLACGACRSSCCDAEPTEAELEEQRKEHEMAKKLKYIELIMRVMRDEPDHIVTAAVKKVIDDQLQSPVALTRQLTLGVSV
jgi:hypothetical protein